MASAQWKEPTSAPVALTLEQEVVQLRREKAALLKALHTAMDCAWATYRTNEDVYARCRDAIADVHGWKKPR